MQQYYQHNVLDISLQFVPLETAIFMAVIQPSADPHSSNSLDLRQHPFDFPPNLSSMVMPKLTSTANKTAPHPRL